jgi:hypothetical protein
MSAAQVSSWRDPSAAIASVVRHDIIKAKEMLIAIDGYSEVGTGALYHAIESIRRFVDCIDILAEDPDAAHYGIILDYVSEGNTELRAILDRLARLHERRAINRAETETQVRRKTEEVD